jgi:hypothetical protein
MFHFGFASCLPSTGNVGEDYSGTGTSLLLWKASSCLEFDSVAADCLVAMASGVLRGYLSTL